MWKTAGGKCWISFWGHNLFFFIPHKRHLQSLDWKQRQILWILFLITVFYSIHLLNSYPLCVLLCYQGNDNERNQHDHEESRDEYRCTSRDVVGRPHDFQGNVLDGVAAGLSSSFCNAESNGENVTKIKGRLILGDSFPRVIPRFWCTEQQQQQQLQQLCFNAWNVVNEI